MISHRFIMLLRAVMVLAILVSTANCIGKKELTQEEQRQVSNLRSELQSIGQDILAAEEENRRYSGGLVKSLIAVRLEVLKTTQALVQQRIHAIEAGAPVKVETIATNPDPNRADQIAEEVRRQVIAVESARSEASQYSGGLVGALKLSSAATEENTLAMLRQQYVLTKYGLAMPATNQSSETPAGDSSREPHSASVGLEQSPASEQNKFEIIAVDARVTETNSSWSKYAWKLTVRNLTTVSLGLEATIEFQDGDGFVVDDDHEYDLVLGPGKEETFTGYDLIDASVAGRVSNVSAKVKER